MLTRKLFVNVLYDVASALCNAADKLTPANDEIWRDRRWKQWDAMAHKPTPIRAEVQHTSDPSALVFRWKCWDCRTHGPETLDQRQAKAGLDGHIWMFHSHNQDCTMGDDGKSS